MIYHRILLDAANGDGAGGSGTGDGNGTEDKGAGAGAKESEGTGSGEGTGESTEEEPKEFIPGLVAALGIDVPLTDATGNRLYVDAEGNETLEGTANFIKENIFSKLKEQAAQEVGRTLNVLDKHFLDYVKHGGNAESWKNHLGEITYSRVLFNGDDDPLRKDFTKIYLTSMGLDEASATQLIEANSRDKAVWKEYTDKLLVNAQSKQAEKAAAVVAAQELANKNEQESLVKFFTDLSNGITKDGTVPNTQIFIPEADRAAVVAYFTAPKKQGNEILTQAQIDMNNLGNNPAKWAQTAILINYYGDKLGELISAVSKSSINRYFTKKQNKDGQGGSGGQQQQQQGGFRPKLLV